MFDNFWNFQGGGGVTASSLKWKIRRGGGVLYDIPSVVGVWIFSGTTHFKYTHKKEDIENLFKLVLILYFYVYVAVNFWFQLIL